VCGQHPNPSAFTPRKDPVPIVQEAGRKLKVLGGKWSWHVSRHPVCVWEGATLEKAGNTFRIVHGVCFVSVFLVRWVAVG